MSRNTHNRQLDHHGTDLATNILLGAPTTTYPVGANLNTVLGDIDNRITASSLTWKGPCRVATTGNVDLATGLVAGSVIDGVTLAAGDRVLVRAQTTASENGIYVAPSSGAASRATDADTGSELEGAATIVREGTTNGDTVWFVTTNGSIVLGVTAISWTRLTPTSPGSGTTSSAPGDSTSHGTSTDYARTDHRHGREAWATTAELADVASTESAGTSGTVPRGDHTHRLGIATTKGDLLVHDGANVTRLGVGTNGQVLTADSAQTTGVKWASPPAPGTGTTSSAPGDATSHGTSTDYARTDHRHGREAFGGAGAAHTGLSGAAGSAGTVSRGDHAHPAQLSLDASLTTDYLARVRVSGDTQYRWQVAADGMMQWGPGGTTAPDVNLYRSTTNRLKTDDEFEVGRTNTSDVAYIVRRGSDQNAAFVVYGDGRIEWGPGGSSARDVNLYRGGPNILKTDNVFDLGPYPTPDASRLGLGYLELRGTTPFIDFSNDAAVDFHVRLRLVSNTILSLGGGALRHTDFPGFFWYYNSNTGIGSIANGGTVTVSFSGTPTRDSYAFWSSGTPTRITIPSSLGGGVYLVVVHVDSAAVASSSGLFRVAARRNGTTTIAEADTFVSGSSSYWMTAVTHYLFTAGDYIEILLTNSTGQTRSPILKSVSLTLVSV